MLWITSLTSSGGISSFDMHASFPACAQSQLPLDSWKQNQQLSDQLSSKQQGIQRKLSKGASQQASKRPKLIHWQSLPCATNKAVPKMTTAKPRIHQVRIEASFLQLACLTPSTNPTATTADTCSAWDFNHTTSHTHCHVSVYIFVHHSMLHVITAARPDRRPYSQASNINTELRRRNKDNYCIPTFHMQIMH